MSDKPLVSFVVLNWNGLADTKECLKSLRQQTYRNTELIVVDNGSKDGSKEYFQTLKDIVYLDLDKNYGFTGGHIKGAEAAKGDYLAIINNDLVLDRNWTTEAMATMSRYKDAAVVGGKLYKWNDKNPAYSTKNEFTTWQEVDPKTGYTRTLLTGEEERRVDSISGAALLIKCSAIKEVGYFDDDFFAYYEETDLIARLTRAGYAAYFSPKAHAWHKVAGSSEGGEESYFYLYMMHRNRYLFGVKNLDQPYFKLFKRNYFNEYLRALVGSVVDRTTDRRARINAYHWNRKHLSETLAKRATVVKGGGSYVSKLGASAPIDVTVVIPCYNYGQYVGEAIESVLKQSLLPKRIIVLNDGSTDNSATVLEKYQEHPLIEVVNKKNEGVIATKNMGLEMTKTYWVLFFDADDLMMPDYIRELVKLGNEQRSDVVYSDMQLFDAKKKGAVFMAGDFSISRLIRRNFIHNSALIKTTMAKLIGGYKPVMKDGLEDWELYLTLAEANAKFVYMPFPLFLYRQHQLAMSRNAAVVKKEKELYQLLLSLHPRLKKYANPFLTRGLTISRAIIFLIFHPIGLLIIIKAIPRGILAFLRTLAHDLRHYKAKIDNGV